MAKTVQVIMTSDLSDSPADETVKFSLDGITYEIDLTTAEATLMRTSFEQYTQVARRAGGRRPTTVRTPTKRTQVPSDSSTIRAWAAAQGLVKANQRGPLSKAIKERYEAAHAA
jgi:hypothetical protein